MKTCQISMYSVKLKLAEDIHNGDACGICKQELFDSDDVLLCSATETDRDRAYHVHCLKVERFSSVISQDILLAWQKKENHPAAAEWKCFCCCKPRVCSLCIPARTFQPRDYFFRCRFYHAEFHQHHFTGQLDRVCFFCDLSL